MLGLTPHFRRRLTEIVVLSISFTAQLGFAETDLSKSCGSLLFPAQRYVSPITDQDRTLSVSRRKGQSFTDEQAHIVHTRDFFIQLMDSKKAFAIYELYVGGQKIRRILFMTDWIDPVYDSAHEVIQKGVEKILISYPLDVPVDLRLLTKGYLRPTESGAEVYELASGKIYAYQGAMGSTLSREAQLIKKHISHGYSGSGVFSKCGIRGGRLEIDASRDGCAARDTCCWDADLYRAYPI